MTVREKASIWLIHQTDISHDLSYVARQELKSGGHEQIAETQIRKLKKQVRYSKLSAGFTGTILVIVGLYKLAMEFGLFASEKSPESGVMGEAILYILGAAAISTLFRTIELEKRCAIFDSALEIDAFIEREGAAI